MLFSHLHLSHILGPNQQAFQLWSMSSNIQHQCCGRCFKILPTQAFAVTTDGKLKKTCLNCSEKKKHGSGKRPQKRPIDHTFDQWDDFLVKLRDWHHEVSFPFHASKRTSDTATDQTSTSCSIHADPSTSPQSSILTACLFHLEAN